MGPLVAAATTLCDARIAVALHKLRRATGDPSPPPALAEVVEDRRRQLDVLWERRSEDPWFGRSRARDLGVFDLLVLGVLLVCELDGEALRQAFGDPRLPTRSFVLSVLGEDRDARRLFLQRLGPSAPLRRFSWVTVGSEDRLELDEGVAEQLLGGDGASFVGKLEAKLGGVGRVRVPTRSWSDLVVAPAVEAEIRQVADRLRWIPEARQAVAATVRTTPPTALVTHVSGPAGSGKSVVVDVLAAEIGRPVVRVATPALLHGWPAEAEARVTRLFDTVRGKDVLLHLAAADVLFLSHSAGRGSDVERGIACVSEQIAAADGPVVLSTRLRSGSDDGSALRHDLRIELGAPGAEERRRFWARLLDSSLLLPPAPWTNESEDRWPLTLGGMESAVIAAIGAVPPGKRIDLATLAAALDAEVRRAGRTPGDALLLRSLSPGNSDAPPPLRSPSAAEARRRRAGREG